MATTYETAITAPVRKIKAKIDLYSSAGYTSGEKTATYTGDDRIIKFDIQRIGADGKWFGFGICQKLNVHLIDRERQLDISTDNLIEVGIGVVLEDGTTKWGYNTPLFRVSEVHRDEKTNELSITAYDYLYQASKYTVNDLALIAPYTIYGVMEKVYQKLGFTGEDVLVDIDPFDLSFPDGANFDGSENLREVLDMIAEATQTIYYVEAGNVLAFDMLDQTMNAYSIGRGQYFELKNNGGRRLQTICNATELGDNVSESTTLIGSTQYVRDNAFWELREDIATLVHEALERIGDTSIGQFECSWRGDPSISLCSKLELTTKDNQVITSYLLNDTIEFDGGLRQKTLWQFGNGDNETASNPTSLGDALKQTYARVDKANKQITLVAEESSKNASDIAELQLGTEYISSTVQSISQKQSDLSNTVVDIQNGIDEQNQANNEKFDTLTQKVNATMTSEQVKLLISEELDNGVDKVVTETGFKFDNEGLTISKTGSEISTNIDEDGMTISKGSQDVLTANNTGVDAINLTAHQYLVIGKYSRFEDYQSNRTACYWIGG